MGKNLHVVECEVSGCNELCYYGSTICSQGCEQEWSAQSVIVLIGGFSISVNCVVKKNEKNVEFI